MAVKIVDGSSVHKNFDGILKAFLPYAKEKLGYDKPVNIQLVSDTENAKDPFGKTAYYDPNQMKVTVFVDKRHVKDILRSISHELVHHKQNCQGKLYSPAGEGYAQNDPHLREMEAEAYLEGNGFLVRDFEDKIKENENMKKNVLDETIKKAVKKVLSEIADLAEQEVPDAGGGAVQNPEGGDLASKLEAVVGADKVAEVMALLGDAGLDLSMAEGAIEEKMKKDSPDRRPSDTPADRLRPLEEKSTLGRAPGATGYEGDDEEGLVHAPGIDDDEGAKELQRHIDAQRAKKKAAAKKKNEGLKEDIHEEDEDVKEGPAVYMQENWARKALNERIHKTLIKKWCK